MRLLDRLNKPTVARVNGAAIGGGAGLVACCDIAVAAEQARFAFTEVKLGLAPAVISPYVVKAIGARQARRFFLTAESIGARQAQAINLVHQVVGRDELDAAVEAQVNLLLAAGPVAVKRCKELIATVENGEAGSDGLLMRTAELIAELRSSPEGQEGIAAFLEKRPPLWAK
jgi:methylglutaconyl-CoA hydratase